MTGTTVRHHRATIDGLGLHYLTAGRTDDVAPSLVLLHGFPQTSHEWLPLIDRLADHFRILAPDLRGIGGFPGPAAGYDKRTLAADVHGILDQVGASGPVVLCGHDIGAYVAFAYALRYRDQVTGLITIDAPPPGTTIGDGLSANPRTWHIPFHANVDVAHFLISGREREYINYFVASRIYDRSAITPDDIDSYAAAYRAPGALRAGLEMYRSLAQDSADNKASLAEGRLRIPVTAVASAVTAIPAALEAMVSEMAENGHLEIVAEAGHWIPEEQPERLAEIVLATVRRAGVAP
jgi:pimeloyl-ACP methyl ester carboxylesterase